jgi:hypothetical protein
MVAFKNVHFLVIRLSDICTRRNIRNVLEQPFVRNLSGLLQFIIDGESAIKSPRNANAKASRNDSPRDSICPHDD